ncbi:MAG: heterodisulfide reductase-related iron-sulfur binding cluster [Cyclobacteriaceae bacterium]|nr:heterodisulfide reductase-related iron-sulfur binding cluster [Cyclobacteriaceae bacterium]
MLETREIYRNFPLVMQLAFYAIAFLAIAIFLYGFYRKYKKYKQGRDANRFNNLFSRFMKAAAIMGKNSTVFKRDKYAGYAHWLIFWGFIVLLIGTALVALDHDFLRFLDIHLLQGTFYLWFSLTLDVFGALFIVGLVMMMLRRVVQKLPQLDYSRPDLAQEKYSRKGYSTDDKIFLWLLLLVAITGFVIEGFRISADGMPPFEKWSPVGWTIAGMISSMSTDTANSFHMYSWWFHAVMVMFFIAYIPYSKAIHMLIDYANLMFIDEMAAKKLPGVTEEQQDKNMGYVELSDFTWKELMDFDACTKCGRCHVACPANAAGTSLSPRDIILDLRTFTNENSKEFFNQTFTTPQKEGCSIAGDVISADRLWSCTTCMACVEACPVGIEHLTSIVNLRRALVEEGDMEDSLQDALANIGDYGNSFGQSERNRAKWTSKLDFKIKDVRKEAAEFMWFVGDFASYDAGIQELTLKVATVMNKIGVDFGLLFDGEKNSGNDIRRVGEEGLYEMLAEDNIETFSSAKFKEIFTTDPHSYNTIKNEYPEFGGEYSIFHYTGLLLRLHEEGKLNFTKKLNYKVTYHDPCYLGRYNGETEAPRKLLEAMGVELVEMPRNKENSFCCGAGGGRVWMDDSKMEARPSEIRIKEAISLGNADHFIVCCPKDYSMFSDAVKTTGNEDKMVVKDIIQLVEEAIS